jgi:hypothetical protein
VHRLFGPFSYLNRPIRKRRAYRDSPSTDTSASETKSDGDSDVLDDSVLRNWIMDRKTHTSIRIAVENNDLLGLMQSVSPGMVRIFQIYANDSILDIFNNEILAI